MVQPNDGMVFYRDRPGASLIRKPDFDLGLPSFLVATAPQLGRRTWGTNRRQGLKSRAYWLLNYHFYLLPPPLRAGSNQSYSWAEALLEPIPSIHCTPSLVGRRKYRFISSQDCKVLEVVVLTTIPPPEPSPPPRNAPCVPSLLSNLLEKGASEWCLS